MILKTVGSKVNIHIYQPWSPIVNHLFVYAEIFSEILSCSNRYILYNIQTPLQILFLLYCNNIFFLFIKVEIAYLFYALYSFIFDISYFLYLKLKLIHIQMLSVSWRNSIDSLIKANWYSMIYNRKWYFLSYFLFLTF